MPKRMISEVSPGAAGEGEGMSQEEVCVCFPTWAFSRPGWR